MSEEKKIYFAVKAFILHEEKFLVVHKPIFEEDIWELPGGRTEFGETAEDTVKREVFEETGLHVNPIRILDTWNHVNDQYQITGIIYLCSFQGGEVQLSSEHNKFMWIETDERCLSRLHQAFSERIRNWDWNKIIKSGVAF